MLSQFEQICQDTKFFYDPTYTFNCYSKDFILPQKF